MCVCVCPWAPLTSLGGPAAPAEDLRRVDQWQPRRWRSASDAAGGPESVDVERIDVSETADRFRLKDPRGVRSHRVQR
eukprot:9369220-Pyramimonas_sp.AAC.1